MGYICCKLSVSDAASVPTTCHHTQCAASRLGFTPGDVLFKTRKNKTLSRASFVCFARVRGALPRASLVDFLRMMPQVLLRLGYRLDLRAGGGSLSVASVLGVSCPR